MRLLVGATGLLTACGAPPPPAAELPPHSFSFGVSGDGPYRIWERGRRLAAAIQWLDAAFALAREKPAKGVVLALHGNPGEGDRWIEPPLAFDPLVRSLKTQVAAFPGQVLLIHGETHVQRVDQPLVDAEGRIFENFTRLETFGSPDIGWVRVVVDSVAGRFTHFEPRRMPGSWW